MQSDRRWRPTAAIRLSIWLHFVCAIVLMLTPSSWPWILAILALCHLTLTAAGLWPRSRLLGPNLLRLPQAAARLRQVAVTFDDGPDPDVTPKVLDLLDRYAAKASFFCIGEKAAKHPDIIREITRRGHSVENHSLRHSPLFAFFGLAALRRDIGAAQSVLRDISGTPPAFFRAPMGLRSPLLDPVVTALGLKYVSWTRRGFDAVQHDPTLVLARLTHGLAAGDILLLHDTTTVHGEPTVLTVLPQLLERIASAGLEPVSLQTAVR